jgi:hypothetical protein
MVRLESISSFVSNHWNDERAVEPLRDRFGDLEVEAARFFAAVQAVERDVLVEADREVALGACGLAAEANGSHHHGGEQGCLSNSEGRPNANFLLLASVFRLLSSGKRHHLPLVKT